MGAPNAPLSRLRSRVQRGSLAPDRQIPEDSDVLAVPLAAIGRYTSRVPAIVPRTRFTPSWSSSLAAGTCGTSLRTSDSQQSASGSLPERGRDLGLGLASYRPRICGLSASQASTTNAAAVVPGP